MPTQELEVQQPGSVVAVQREPSFMDVIADAARDSRVDVDKMERLLAMRAQEMAREARTAYGNSMRAAQEEMRPILRDAQNDFSKARYARLESIDKVIRPIYTKHGFALSFGSKEAKKSDSLAIVCRVSHAQGHHETHELEGPVDSAGSQGKSNKTGIQALGSAATYLRRYLTCMIFNVIMTNEDDDGNGGTSGAISPDQADALNNLIHEIGMDEASVGKFLKVIGVRSVGEIPKTNYKVAINLLDSKRRIGK
jgi:hypothetical protein